MSDPMPPVSRATPDAANPPAASGDALPDAPVLPPTAADAELRDAVESVTSTETGEDR